MGYFMRRTKEAATQAACAGYQRIWDFMVQ